jgi:ABC-type Fe3+/spermidine/putrescine transport system ATPase subunit
MTAILATHDQEEAYFFSDRMAVLSAGRIVADAAPEDIYRNPGTAWLARFTGEANILSGAELHAAFPGWQPRAGSWLLRPEQIRPEPLAEGAAADGVVTNLAFTGRSTGIVVRTTAGIVLRASVPGAHGCRIGGPVRLALIEPPAELRG